MSVEARSEEVDLDRVGRGRIDTGLELPAVRLDKMGDSYFVENGDHRVRIARYQGAKTIEAEVTEFSSLYRAPSECAAKIVHLGDARF